MQTDRTAQRRFIRLFKPRFAALVERGLKTQTVRPTPKRMPVPGDIIECRYWSGRPYHSTQMWCAEGRITRVVRCEIREGGIALGPPAKEVKDHRGLVVMTMTPAETEFPDKEAFARADGFASWAEMWDWFCEEHGLRKGHLGSGPPRFVGVLMQWEHLLPDWHGKEDRG